jgi:hypothetical protein
MSRSRSTCHFKFFVKTWIVDQHLEHKAVLLGFREWVGPLLFDRVLCGQHEKGIAQRMPHATDGNLALLHRFQQCGLGLGRGAVDLVSQDHVGKQRALHEAAL